jgi:hypothetical protein
MSRVDRESLEIYLTHANTEPVDDVLSALGGLDVVVVTPESIWGPKPFKDQVVGVIREANLVLAVLDGANTNVFFEIGIATGLGTPIVLLSRGKEPRASSFESMYHVGRTSDPETLNRAIYRALQPPTLGVTDDHASIESAISRESANHLLLNLNDGLLAPREFEANVEGFLELCGAQFIRQPESAVGMDPIARPDLVIWHDDLETAFGLPLPVELLVGTFNLEAILPRLVRTLTLSGARSLLAISARRNEPIQWVDGNRQVLAVSLLHLIELCAQVPLGGAFAILRSQARRVGIRPGLI